MQSDIITDNIFCDGSCTEIDTEKMISYIEKYGVDHQDRRHYCLLFYIKAMTNHQIDIFLSYKPNVCVKYLSLCTPEPYVPTPFLDDEFRKDIYPFLRLLEYDEEAYMDDKTYDYMMLTLTEKWGLSDVWHEESVKEIIDILESKHRFTATFFDWMLFRFWGKWKEEEFNKKHRL